MIIILAVSKDATSVGVVLIPNFVLPAVMFTFLSIQCGTQLKKPSDSPKRLKFLISAVLHLTDFANFENVPKL